MCNIISIKLMEGHGMKKAFAPAAVMLAAALLLGGCAASTAGLEHKTEAETVNVTTGMFAQAIDKNVTYVQNGSDWTEESSEITDWKLAEGYDIQDTVWVFKNDDATAMTDYLDSSFFEKPATCYFHFGTDLGDMQTEIIKSGDKPTGLKVTLGMTAELVFQCKGQSTYMYGIEVNSAEISEDGSVVLSVGANGDTFKINVPAGVQSCEWDKFLQEESSTFIASTSFDDLPSFEVTSSCLEGGVWDTKITNTSSGENLSPDLAWEPVDGASQYVVIMIDGAWLHMDVFTTETSLAEGAYGSGSKGAQYVGPYPPKGNPHTYSVFVFALAGEPGDVTLSFDSSGNTINNIYEALDTDANGNTGNVIAYGRLDGNFTLF